MCIHSVEWANIVDFLVLVVVETKQQSEHVRAKCAQKIEHNAHTFSMDFILGRENGNKMVQKSLNHP